MEKYSVKHVILNHLADLKTGLLKGRLFQNRREFLNKIITEFYFDDSVICKKIQTLENTKRCVEDFEKLVLSLKNDYEIDIRTIMLYFWNHPELQEDEVYLVNIKEGEVWTKPDFISELRVGEVAYTTYGVDKVPDMKPLFGKLK